MIHKYKLNALLDNPKLPPEDLPMVHKAIEEYDEWIKKLDAIDLEGNELLERMIELLNEYKFFIEFKLIFCSKQDFLYRQKGQLKLDNTILEEFLPRLADSRLVPSLKNYEGLDVGPRKCFAGLSFGESHLLLNSGGVFLKGKDQDFSISKKVHIKASTSPTYSNNVFESDINVGFIVGEIKTNLDKTMFQEASATSRELKNNVSGAVYLLLVEWLDMPPIDSKRTHIDEVILLRKAKRLNSNIRSKFSNSTSRIQVASEYKKYLEEHPYRVDSFMRIVNHIQACFPETTELDVQEVLDRGYF
ncbi:MAG: Bpu10I family restriction endonuclease [Methylococcales bacterium]|nr:Bpu10I family restriction endonuclease [Methylococcales bacterium]